MMWLLRRLVGLLLVLALALFAYGGWGFWQAWRAAPALAMRADVLIAEGRGGIGLGTGRAAQFLAVEDPAFSAHIGVDPTTAGAGATTVTQALAKQLASDQFVPGLAKIKQSGYALGLEQRLSKQQILALFLDTVPMGQGPGGVGWVDGIFAASLAHFGKPVADLSDPDFISLIAVMIAPADLSLAAPSPALADRVARIEALLAGKCAPLEHGDVWLDGCADVR
jgi:hypothetical protein